VCLVLSSAIEKTPDPKLPLAQTASIEDPAMIQKIFAHLEEKAVSAAPGMLPKCRVPPLAGLFKGL
jgi:hypothetical protein